MAFWRQGSSFAQALSRVAVAELAGAQLTRRAIRESASVPTAPVPIAPVPIASPAPRNPPAAAGQWQCRGALKGAVNTHRSGARGKGFPLLQSLRDVLKHFPKRAVFLGGLSGCCREGSNLCSEGLVQISAPPAGDSCERGAGSGQSSSLAAERL